MNSSCTEPHFPPSLSIKQEEGDLCISPATCIVGRVKELCSAIFSSLMRMKLILSLEFYYSLAKPSFVVLCTSKNPFYCH